jgi:hypothetical protein
MYIIWSYIYDTCDHKGLVLLTEKTMMKGELQILQLQLAKQRYFSDNCTTTSSEAKPKFKADIPSKFSIFCCITPCSPLKIDRLFGGTCGLHLQGPRIS